MTAAAAAFAPGALPTPCERLALSRDRIRQALADAAPGERAAGADAASWRDELRSVPGAELLLEVLDQWWSQHPLRAAGLAALALLRSAIEPLVRRHPLQSLLGALLIGGLLVWLRPWRWVLGTTLLAGLLQRMVAGAMAPPKP
ncbi:MAG TPA: hypothetical protein VLI72_04715 [Methylibium sp.]|nr:hypothetical protein [Methylibium sp.]